MPKRRYGCSLSRNDAPLSAPRRSGKTHGRIAGATSPTWLGSAWKPACGKPTSPACSGTSSIWFAKSPGSTRTKSKIRKAIAVPLCRMSRSKSSGAKSEGITPMFSVIGATRAPRQTRKHGGQRGSDEAARIFRGTVYGAPGPLVRAARNTVTCASGTGNAGIGGKGSSLCSPR